MLAQVPRQILHGCVKLKKFIDASFAQTDSYILELSLSRVFRIFPLPCMYQARQTPERFVVKPEHLTNFARRRSPAISDHVRRHGCAKFSIALVNILNRPLTL